MKLKLKATPEQVELIKRVGSKDRLVCAEASEAFAAFISDVTLKVLNQAGTAGMIYDDLVFDPDDNPSIPLDLYYDVNAGNITVWSQQIAGGLATSQPAGVNEMKISTYTLGSAISFLKKYARKSRLDVIAAGVKRMSQELLIKQERNAWSVIMKAVAEAKTTNGRPATAGTNHVIRATTAGTFLIDDLNDLMVRVKRTRVSFANGTPDGNSTRLTDMFVSPEIMGQIRGFAYNPLNSTAGPTSTVGTPVGSTVGIPLPESMREQIFRNVGASELFGVNFVELTELGVGQKYNTVFDNYADATAYLTLAGGGSAVFAGASEEILVGFDLGAEAFKRAVVKDENSSILSTQVDDQFVARQDTVGWWTQIEEGRCCISAQGCFGLIV